MPSTPAILASEWALGVAGFYIAIGVAVALAFALFGVRRALGVSGAVTPGARLLFLPAAALLWPLVLRRWLAAPP